MHEITGAWIMKDLAGAYLENGDREKVREFINHSHTLFATNLEEIILSMRLKHKVLNIE